MTNGNTRYASLGQEGSFLGKFPETKRRRREDYTTLEPISDSEFGLIRIGPLTLCHKTSAFLFNFSPSFVLIDNCYQRG